MKTIEQEDLIHASLTKVWRAFVDPEVIEQWGGGSSAKMDDHEGVEFRLWGGDIHGTNTKIILNKLLVQEWFADHFEQPSEVTFEFVERGNETIVNLTHKNVPDDRVQDISEGWRKYYLGPIKDLLES